MRYIFLPSSAKASAWLLVSMDLPLIQAVLQTCNFEYSIPALPFNDIHGECHGGEVPYICIRKAISTHYHPLWRDRVGYFLHDNFHRYHNGEGEISGIRSWLHVTYCECSYTECDIQITADTYYSSNFPSRSTFFIVSAHKCFYKRSFKPPFSFKI